MMRLPYPTHSITSLASNYGKAPFRGGITTFTLASPFMPIPVFRSGVPSHGYGQAFGSNLYIYTLLVWFYMVIGGIGMIKLAKWLQLSFTPNY